jgi:pyruvate/2-oxoglutarate dehydrogenase complex dihydrolipoamide acyltransferase (E2) component
MPKAGMAMEEGTIVKWLKAEGETVQQGEPLLEILTDKVNMEVEAQTTGTLIKILKREGEVVPVTQVIGYIGAAGEAAPDAPAVHLMQARHPGGGSGSRRQNRAPERAGAPAVPSSVAEGRPRGQDGCRKLRFV